MLQLYDRISPHSFRIVNNRDIVARLPRSSRVNRLVDEACPNHKNLYVPSFKVIFILLFFVRSLLGFEHVGRTVLLDRDGLGEMWLQRRKAQSGAMAAEYNNNDNNDNKTDMFSSLRNMLKTEKRRSEEYAVEDLSIMSTVLSPLAPVVEFTDKMRDKTYAE